MTRAPTDPYKQHSTLNTLSTCFHTHVQVPQLQKTPTTHSQQEFEVREFPVTSHGRHLLATPCGVLFNELRHSPDVVLKCTQKMLRHVLELDTGRFPIHAPDKQRMILFVIRFAARIRNFATVLVENDSWRETGPPVTSSRW